MSSIADNIANVNTVGFKAGSVPFQTLVTKQTSLTTYSAGGVQSRPRANIDVQGLLMSTSISTDIAISGNGFFVVNEAAHPNIGNMWAYSRAGSFRMDGNGYLSNVGGMFLQAWPLMPFDGNPNAVTVVVNNIVYMKAYKDSAGITHYINDNIINAQNLKPINLSTIGGSADPTRQIRMGANLPANANPFDPANPVSGREQMSALVYDSLGNAHNLNFIYTKTTGNSWDMAPQIPPGAANLVLYSQREITTSLSEKVYAAAGQLEFTNIPANGSFIKITDSPGTPNAQTFVYEFTTTGTGTYVPQAGETVILVDIQIGVVSISEAMNRFAAAIQSSMPDGARFTADNNRVLMTQSLSGSTVSFDASACIQCVQSSSNPSQLTGIPTGIFVVPEIDWTLKNVGVINFQSTYPADYINNSFTIGTQTYLLVDGPPGPPTPGLIEVDISTAISGSPATVDRVALTNTIMAALYTNAENPENFTNQGMGIQIAQTETGVPIVMDFSNLAAAATGLIKNNGATSPISITSGSVTLTNGFIFNGIADGERGALAPAIRFSDIGLPMYFNVANMSIDWANGAQNMSGNPQEGVKVTIFQGNANTRDGFTHLAGPFNPNYITQDGARFGSYVGVSISRDGLVVALFDNGMTRPVAQIPVATFTNPNGLSAMTGNAWMETTFSGAPTLRTADSGGAGSVTSNSLEQSTVDLSEQFTEMITTQRAYSASSKIIVTASDMLTELMNIVR